MSRHPSGRSVASVLLVALVTATLVAVGGSASAATINVNCKAGGDLQSKLTSAPTGSTILIKGTCLGSFSFAGKTLTLKGNPSATLDGMDAGPTLFAAGPTHLVGLTVTGGFFGFGAGVVNSGGLTLKNVKVSGNLTTSTTTAVGGGILAFNNLTIDSSTISSNRASAVGDGATTLGAGIFAAGNVKIANSVISGNVATTYSGSGSGEVDGSAISTGGKLTINNTKILGNSAATGGDGGESLGAAVYVESSSGAAVSITKSTVSGNSTAAVSSTTTSGTAAGTIIVQSAPLAIAGSKVTGNRVMATSTNAGMEAVGGGAYGTASIKVTGSSIASNVAKASGTGPVVVAGTGLFGASVTVAKSTIAGNAGSATSSAGIAEALAAVYSGGAFKVSKSTLNGNTFGADATGGDAIGYGAVFGGTLNMNASTISRNKASAKTRTSGQSAIALGGGGFFVGGSGKNSTIALNRVTGTSPAVGGTTMALAGGMYVPASMALTDVTVAGNTVAGSGATLTRQGGGLYGSSGTTLKGTIVGTNSAPQGPDCFGGPHSNGHNLIGKTAGCTFTKVGSDKVNKNPKLRILKNNGGPTQTMAIAGTSPARNTGVCPPHVDQRGVHRPQGPKCDIGAFELKASEASTATALFRAPTHRSTLSVGPAPSVTMARVSKAIAAIPDLGAFLDRIRGLSAVKLRLP